MTAPAELTPEQQQAYELAQQHAEEIAELEAHAVQLALGASGNVAAALLSGLFAQWTTAFAGAAVLTGIEAERRAAAVVAWLAGEITKIALEPVAALLEVGPKSRARGAAQAREAAGLPKSRGRKRPPVTDESRKAAEDSAAEGHRLLAAAHTLLGDAKPEKPADLVPVVGMAQRAVNGTTAATEWAVNHEANEGVRDEAKATGAELIWLQERDACVHCLAYGGEIGTVESGFPVGLSFDAKPLRSWPDAELLLGPPLHPRCRCHLQLWFGDSARSPKGYADVLKHEAERSILKGWRKPSESEKVRLAAAQRLLSKGTDLPKSVVAEARYAVKTGKFASRKVPD